MKQVNQRKQQKKGCFDIIFSRVGYYFAADSHADWESLRNELTFAAAGIFDMHSCGIIRFWMRVIVIIYVLLTSEDNPAFKIDMDIMYHVTFPVVGTLFYIYVKLQLETTLCRRTSGKLKNRDRSQYMVQDHEI